MATALRSVVILFSFFPSSSPATHSLDYHIMATSGISTFPEFIIDGYINGKAIFHYDSNERNAVIKQDWMVTFLPADYLNTETKKANGAEQVFKRNIDILKARFNHTKGIHTVQSRYGCLWDDQTGHKDGYKVHGYNGEDFLQLDVENQWWSGRSTQAFITAQKWNRVKPELEMHVSYIKNECTEWLKKYIQYGNNTTTKVDADIPVRPIVSVYEKQGYVLVCHATGFCPEGVMITWMKDGVEITKNVTLSETLPNGSGTFQKRALLQVSPEELKGVHVYTCEVEHTTGQTKQNLILENRLPIGFVLFVLCVVSVPCIFLIVMKLKRCENTDYQKKGSNKDYIQTSQPLDPHIKTNPDLVSKSSDDSQPPTGNKSAQKHNGGSRERTQVNRTGRAASIRLSKTFL